MIGHHFQRHVAAEARVTRAKHRPYPAGAERADDFVLGQPEPRDQLHKTWSSPSIVFGRRRQTRPPAVLQVISVRPNASGLDGIPAWLTLAASSRIRSSAAVRILSISPEMRCA